MKRMMSFVVLLTVLFALTSCSFHSRQDAVLNSMGSYDSKAFYTHGEFQDYTDYAVYAFSTTDLESNQYFTKITTADLETIFAFIDNYEMWINTLKENNPSDDLVVNYSFDRTIVDTEDFFYIYEEENQEKFGCYEVWFFDSQTSVLYYFHNNI